jgi:hypothetical protein
MNRPFRTFAAVALGCATLAVATTREVAHAQLPVPPKQVAQQLYAFSVNLDLNNTAPQFAYNNAGAEVMLRLQTVNVYEGGQLQLLPGSEFVVLSQRLPSNLPKGQYTLTVNAMPGPTGATFTAFNPVGNGTFQNGATVGNCSLPKGDYKTLMSCTMNIPMSPFATNSIDVNVTVNNMVWFRNMTLAYALQLQL